MHFTRLLSQPDRGGVRLVDLFRYIMHLGWDSLMTPGTIPIAWRQEAETVANQLGLVKGRSVILFPDNNTNWPVADELWQKLADQLVEQALTVVTNVHGNDLRNYHGNPRQALAGTVGYSIPLHLAAPLVEFAGGFVSGCNGMSCMLIGTARARAAILLHETMPGQCGWSGEDVYQAWEQSLKLHEFDYSGIHTYDLQEYVIYQGQENRDALAQIVQQMAG